MNTNAFKDIEKLETDLWEAADNLCTNSKLYSSDNFMLPPSQNPLRELMT